MVINLLMVFLKEEAAIEHQVEMFHKGKLMILVIISWANINQLKILIMKKIIKMKIIPIKSNINRILVTI